VLDVADTVHGLEPLVTTQAKLTNSGIHSKLGLLDRKLLTEGSQVIVKILLDTALELMDF